MNKQKWTLERVQGHLDGILADACSDEVSHLTIALVRQGLYKQIWPYWKSIFADHEEVMEVMMRIDSIFEAKLYHSGLNKTVSPWMAMFGLKHNYKWENTSGQPPQLPETQQAPRRNEEDPLMMIRLPNDEIRMVFRDRERSGLYKKVQQDKLPPAPQINPEEGQ